MPSRQSAFETIAEKAPSADVAAELPAPGERRTSKRLSCTASARDEWELAPVMSTTLSLTIVVLGASGDLAKK
ncbi:hypothetical protein HaLaN_24195, partial [Haematococcus lacustris]